MDYVATPNVVFFTGNTMQIVTIPIVADSVRESDETFTVLLVSMGSTGNGVIDPARGTVTITNGKLICM